MIEAEVRQATGDLRTGTLPDLMMKIVRLWLRSSPAPMERRALAGAIEREMWKTK